MLLQLHKETVSTRTALRKAQGTSLAKGKEFTGWEDAEEEEEEEEDDDDEDESEEDLSNGYSNGSEAIPEGDLIDLTTTENT